MNQEHTAPRKRVRIEVGTSTKGVHTYSATVELVNDLEGHGSQEILWIENVGHPHSYAARGRRGTLVSVAQAVLDESDWLVAELDKRYPVEL